MFENVTYTFYSDTLGRAVIPTEDEFEKYKLLNVQYMKSIIDFVEEREIDGIDAAVCMMCEIDYLADNSATLNADNKLINSESVAGHSVSYDNTQATKESELNAKSIEEKKMRIIKLFCDVYIGV